MISVILEQPRMCKCFALICLLVGYTMMIDALQILLEG